MTLSPNHQSSYDTECYINHCKYCEKTYHIGYFNDSHFTKCHTCKLYICDQCFSHGYLLEVREEMHVYSYKIADGHTDRYDAGFGILDDICYVCSELCNDQFHI